MRQSGEWGIGLKYSSLFLLRQTEYLLIESIFHDIQRSSVVNTAALDVFAIKGISLLRCAASCIFRKLSKSLEKNLSTKLSTVAVRQFCGVSLNI